MTFRVPHRDMTCIPIQTAKVHRKFFVATEASVAEDYIGVNWFSRSAQNNWPETASSDLLPLGQKQLGRLTWWLRCKKRRIEWPTRLPCIWPLHGWNGNQSWLLIMHFLPSEDKPKEYKAWTLRDNMSAMSRVDFFCYSESVEEATDSPYKARLPNLDEASRGKMHWSRLLWDIPKRLTNHVEAAPSWSY